MSDHTQIYQSNVRLALSEDLGDRDLSEGIIRDQIVTAFLKAKDEGLFCGRDWFEESFKQIDKNIEFRWKIKDGDFFKNGDEIVEIKGNINSILKSERTAINFVQFLSGISTNTQKKVNLLQNKKIELLDTRKTIPGLRYSQKYATRIGGARNHRFGLYDAVMIKENHISMFNSLDELELDNIDRGKFLEIEVDALNKIEPALNHSPDVIMFDNLSIEDIKKGIDIVGNRSKIEVSGILNMQHFEEVSKLNIHFISLGELTKNIKSIDFSLLLKSL